MSELDAPSRLKTGARVWTGAALQLRISVRTLLLAAAVTAIVAASACNPKKPMDPAVSESLGPDDGSHIVILYGSEIMGSLEGCGCMGNPKLGGFPYRAAVARAIASANPDVGILQLDAGYASSPITNQSGAVPPELVASLETTYAALSEAGFAAVNVTAQDILVARTMLGTGGAEDKYSGMLVSANLQPISAAFRAPSGFVVRRVARAGGTGSVNIAIVGVTEYPGRLEPSTGFKVTEARGALERAIGEARGKADLVVVLAYMPAAAAGTMLGSLETKPDVAIVASSFGAGSADGSVMGAGLEPRLDGPMKVVYSWYKTQKLGVLRLKLDDLNHVESATNVYVKLDAPIVPDEAAEAMVSRQKEAVRAAKEARYRAEGVQVTNAAP